MTQTSSDTTSLPFSRYRCVLRIKAVAWFLLALVSVVNLPAQQPTSKPNDDHTIVQELLQRVSYLEERVRQLQSKQTEIAAPSVSVTAMKVPTSGDNQSAQAQSIVNTEKVPSSQPDNHEAHTEEVSAGHTMELPGGGPALKIRGFLDFNLGLGTDANPLIYPLGARAHSSFQLGELDLFMTSKLSDTVSFLSEIVIGSDATNAWGVDIDREQLSYN